MNQIFEVHYRELNEARQKYCRDNNIDIKKVFWKVSAEVKNLVEGKSSSTLTLVKSKPWTNEQFQIGILVLKYMYNSIFELSPEKVDALWEENKDNGGKDFLEATGTKGLVDKIVAESLYNSKARQNFKDCLLDTKKFILKTIYPEYYRATYNDKYDIINDVINADEDTIHNLKTLGKIKTTVVNNRSVQMGTVVDEILYEAFEANFKIRNGICSFEDKLKFLSEHKSNHLKQMSFIKIMNNRGCYASPLDFYYLNSPKEMQDLYFKDYKILRSKSQKKDEISEVLNTYLDYKKNHEGDYDFEY